MSQLTPTALALTGFIAWTLALLIVMEANRTRLVIAGKVAANGFTPDNANLSPFMQRLARAHANCIESLPIFGGLMLVALLTGRSAVTDPLAYAFLAARVVQSSIHLASLSAAAVSARFTAFAVQMVIGVVWVVGLLMSAGS
ncbi:MAPEG family protein [Piscinibacter sakaiensis]|uniref:MAPEG family protein n=1 Tax=Piscinibacter sakaiensis TaxID=1547922 RepID=UPI003AACB166